MAPVQTMPSWESMPTTDAETAVIAYLGPRPPRCVGMSLLHVGIGNSSLFATHGSDLERFVGITVSLSEQLFHNSKFANAKHAKIVLANKHDPRSYSQIEGKFDFIVDVNLKSFACCESHFDQLMALYADRLESSGAIITAESGVLFGWGGNTNVAHTPGASLDPSAREQRILGISGLKQLSTRYGLELSSISVPLSAGTSLSEEILWILRKT